MLNRVLTGICVLPLISGCAIHPVPEDVTGVTTFEIVKQIRCESRNAVIDFVKAQLRQQADKGQDPIARKLLADYEADPEAIRRFKPAVFAGPDYVEYRHFYNVIYATAIGYSFDLTMTEQNDLGSNLNFLGPWKSKFTLNVTGDFDRQRSNRRTFTVTDTFQFLLTSLNRLDEHGIPYCEGRIVQPNYVYPIAGEIGVAKTVRTFFQLAFLGGLKLTPGDKSPPVLVDDLKFTTMIDLSGTPKVVFTPIGAGFQIADASLTGLAKRQDIHQVTVGLGVDTGGQKEAAALKEFLFPGSGVTRADRSGGGVAGQSSAVTLNRITAAAGTPSENLVLKAMDQAKSREVQLVPPP